MAGFVAPKRKKRDNAEFRIQSAFVKLWRANCGSLGIAQCLGFHINNGGVFGGGNAEWQKKERQIRGHLADLAGVESGVCDWFLSVPMMRSAAYGGHERWYHGWYVEFKKPGETVKEGSAQDLFIGYATARGYLCEIHTAPYTAWNGLMRYLGKTATET